MMVRYHNVQSFLEYPDEILAAKLELAFKRPSHAAGFWTIFQLQDERRDGKQLAADAFRTRRQKDLQECPNTVEVDDARLTEIFQRNNKTREHLSKLGFQESQRRLTLQCAAKMARFEGETYVKSSEKRKTNRQAQAAPERTDQTRTHSDQDRGGERIQSGQQVLTRPAVIAAALPHHKMTLFNIKVTSDDLTFYRLLTLHDITGNRELADAYSVTLQDIASKLQSEHWPNLKAQIDFNTIREAYRSPDLTKLKTSNPFNRVIKNEMQ